MGFIEDYQNNTIRDFLWYGFARRINGEKGYACTDHMDEGVYGKYNFSYKSSLIYFLDTCVRYNEDMYGVFKKFIDLGAGSDELVNNTELAETWADVSEKYAENFEYIQDEVAFDVYYTVTKTYCESMGIDTMNYDWCIRGALMSIAIDYTPLGAANVMEAAIKSISDPTNQRELAIYLYNSRPITTGRWAEELNDVLFILDHADHYVLACQNTFYWVCEGFDEEKEEPINRKSSHMMLGNAVFECDRLEMERQEGDPHYYVYSMSGFIKVYPKDMYFVNNKIDFGQTENVYDSKDMAIAKCNELSFQNKTTYSVYNCFWDTVYSRNVDPGSTIVMGDPSMVGGPGFEGDMTTVPKASNREVPYKIKTNRAIDLYCGTSYESLPITIKLPKGQYTVVESEFHISDNIVWVKVDAVDGYIPLTDEVFDIVE